MGDFYVHFKYRAEIHDGYERWRYECVRFSEMHQLAKHVRSKGGRQIFVRPLGTQERWYKIGEVATV